MSDGFRHPHALVETGDIGAGTRIWAFAHVLAGATIGRDCNICDHVFIEGDVRIGDRVTVKSGVQLWDGVVVEDDVLIGPNATFTNDRFPRSKVHLASYPKTRVCKGATIGANATLLPGISIGADAMVGAGSVVTRSVPTNAIVVGNPARIVGYVNASRVEQAVIEARSTSSVVSGSIGVSGVTLHRLPLVRDLRGDLSVGEFGRTVPFHVKRHFVVFNVPTAEVRGEHAHYRCHQFLIAVRGNVSVVADDGRVRGEVVLDCPSLGLHIPPLVWGIQYRYSADAVLLVLASEHYDASDYIRDYGSFVDIVGARAEILIGEGT